MVFVCKKDPRSLVIKGKRKTTVSASIKRKIVPFPIEIKFQTNFMEILREWCAFEKLPN